MRPLELGEPRLSSERVNLLRTAADLLRAVSTSITTGEAVTTSTPQYKSFLAALDAMLSDVAGADRVVPIADLFYDDRGPHVVSTSPNPPTTPAQRFRMEVVSLGEHLHKVIDDARAANMPNDNIDRAIKKRTRLRGLPHTRAEIKSLIDHLLRQGFSYELIAGKVRAISAADVDEDDPSVA